ncbi:aquaporin family protein [Nocardioides panacis]|uniref:Aquaporin family protein n=1 Tax=Nocardioides panacis TaxID=2849501 RepID=A0A975Y1W7_9ACTN|nr:MIP/aquaporin family protein [Nocardioides panacis]QWZ09935.1 aquaporin family protein [Nocardioides panacis]
MSPSLLRRLVAEFVGTGLLVLFGAGSVVAALELNRGRLDYAGLGIISLAFGLVVALVIYAVGTTSGAHINPAVTVALAAARRFRWAEVAPYVVAQLLGALVGGLLIVAYVGSRATDLGSVGLTALGPGVNGVQGIVAEALGTFLLVFTIMAVAVDQRAPAGWAGFLIGLAVAVEIMLIGPFSGGSVNPARSFGPYVVNQLFGGSTPWSEFYVYVVGPLVGGVAGALCYDVVARPAAAVPPVGAAVEEGMPGAETPGEPSPEPRQRPSEVPAQSRREAPTRSQSKT